METITVSITKEKSWSCTECCGTTFYVNNEHRITCGACGLVGEPYDDFFRAPNRYERDILKENKTVHSQKVEDGKAMITLVLPEGKFRNNEKVLHLWDTQRKENWRHSHVNDVDVENMQVLEQMCRDARVDDKTRLQSINLLKQLSAKRRIGADSRRTIRKRNVVFVAGVVLAIDTRLHVEPIYEGNVREFVERESEICNPAPKMNAFKHRIIDEFDLIERGNINTRFYLKKNCIDRFNGKIIMLVSMLDMAHLRPDKLVLAAAKIIYSYYGRGDVIRSRNETMKKYVKIIGKKTGIYLDDPSSSSSTGSIFKEKNGVVVTNNNDFYNLVFNDEYDRIIESTNAFLDEIGRENAKVILDVIKMGAISCKYLKHDFQYRGYPELYEIYLNAPFTLPHDDFVNLTPSINDIKKEFEDFINKREVRGSGSFLVNADEETYQFFVGTRLKNRDNIDQRSFNVFRVLRNGKCYVHWNNAYNIDVDDLLSMISFSIENASMFTTVDELYTVMVKKNFIFSSGRAFSITQHGKKTMQYIDFLVKNGFFANESFQLKSKRFDQPISVIPGSKEFVIAKIEEMSRDFKSYIHCMPIEDAKKIVEIACAGATTSPATVQKKLIDNGIQFSGKQFTIKDNPYKIYDTFKFLDHHGIIRKDGDKFTVVMNPDDATRCLESLDVWDKDLIDQIS